MKLSVVTINYNSSENTINFLKSLAEQTDKDFRTIVIDNASEETDFSRLTEAVEDAFLIKSDKNLGFSGGSNIGIKEASKNGSDWVVLLNNDTLVERGFVASLKAELSHLGGIAGIPLDEGDYTAYCGKIGWLKGTLGHIYSPIYAENLTRNPRYYAIGGAVAIHKDVFSMVGFMDEKYFLYFEDADFSIKAERAGFKLTFLEEPKVRHQVSSTTKKLGSALLLRYHYRNALYFNLKNGPWYIKLLVWPWSFWVVIKQLLKIMFMYRQNESSAILKGVFDWYIGRMGKIKNGQKPFSD